MFTLRTTQSPASVSSPAFIWWVVASVALINLFVFSVVTVSLYQSFSEFELRAETTVKNLCQMLVIEIEGDIDKIDVTLLSAADEIERQTASGKVDQKSLNASLLRLQERLPEIFSLRATDANGVVQYGGGVSGDAHLNNSDREYFFRQRDNPQAGLVVARPVFARIDKKWAIPLSRPIHRPDGSFGGVVYVNVGLDYFTKTFSAIDVGRHGSVSLRDTDLRIFARFPLPEQGTNFFGEKLAVPELAELIQAGHDAGTYVTAHTIDGVQRKFAVRKIPNQPLYVVVGSATEEYMVRWKNQAIKTIALAALFCLTTFISAWLIYRSWRRQLNATMELACEEEKFHTVADYTYDWEYWEGPKQEILFMSPSCERVTGYSPTEFLAAPALLGEIIHPDDRPIMASHRHDIAHKEESSVDFRIVRRDGEVRWVAHGCRPVFGRDGTFMGRRASNRDITERKQIEHEVRLAYAYNRSLIEASLDPLVTIGPDGKIMDVNAATEAATGYARDMLIGTEFSDYFSNPASASAGYRQVFREGTVHDYELELRHRDGHLTPVLYNATIYRDDAGNEIGVFAAARDISARKQAEAAVRQLNMELEQRVAQRTAQLETANKELEEFSYSMSHDMRTPLRAIHGFSKILLEEYAARLDDEGRRLLRAVSDNAQRMGRMIDDILLFLRMGKRKLDHGAVNIALLAQEIFAELQSAAPSRRLRLEVAPLPPAWGDAEMIRQVLLNLMTNAIKFSPIDAEAVVEVGGVATEEENTYQVKDYGVGFDMQYVEKLFRVFERVHPTGEYEGNGMGLALVKRIIDRHGGRVWAEGKVGEGATFHFSLPNKRA